MSDETDGLKVFVFDDSGAGLFFGPIAISEAASKLFAIGELYSRAGDVKTLKGMIEGHKAGQTQGN